MALSRTFDDCHGVVWDALLLKLFAPLPPQGYPTFARHRKPIQPAEYRRSRCVQSYDPQNLHLPLPAKQRFVHGVLDRGRLRSAIPHLFHT